MQQAIDDKSRLALFSNLDGLMKMKAAMALEKASEAHSEAGSGLGLGMGVMMPAMLSGQAEKSDAGTAATSLCPACRQELPGASKFCPHCGHHVVISGYCALCGESLPPHAKFCPGCGTPVEQKPEPRKCPHCGTNNLPDSTFCNRCGERIQQP